MKLLKAVVGGMGLALAVVGASSAHAAGNSYGAVQFASLDYEESGFDAISPKAIVFRAGNRLNETIGFEGRFAIGTSEGSTSVSVMGVPLEVSVDVDNIIGAYVTANASVGSTANVYGLIGLARVDLTSKASIPGFASFAVSDSDTGVSFGFGGDIGVNEDVALNIEYMSYYDEDDISIDGMAFGLKFKFQ